MKAGVASPNGIVIQDVPEPKPGPADILVKVKAVALNRADLGAAKAETGGLRPTSRSVVSFLARLLRLARRSAILRPAIA
jgi:NADPH:quinone reductase-like Zn-dependent oxidoreductase